VRRRGPVRLEFGTDIRKPMTGMTLQVGFGSNSGVRFGMSSVAEFGSVGR